MRPSTSNNIKHKFDSPLVLGNDSEKIVVASDGLLTNLFGDKAELSAVDIFNHITKHEEEIDMTSAANYSGAILPGKLCDECTISDNLPTDYEFILRAMKYARQGGSTPKTKGIDSPYIKDIDQLLQRLNYPKAFDLENSDPLILTNYFGTEKENLYVYEDCNLFSPIITPEGLGYSFNSMELWDTFIKTEAVLAFDAEYRTTVPIYEEDDFKCKVKAGVGNQLQFMLRQTFRDVLTGTKTPFRVAIHSPNDIPDKFINLLPGYRYV